MKWIISVIGISIFVAADQIEQSTSNANDDDNSQITKYIESCLIEQDIDIRSLGVSRADDVYAGHLNDLPAEKRGCFVACVYKKRKLIAEDDKLNIDDESFTAEDRTLIDHCRAEKNMCKLGDCLYESLFIIHEEKDM